PALFPPPPRTPAPPPPRPPPANRANCRRPSPPRRPSHRRSEQSIHILVCCLGQRVRRFEGPARHYLRRIRLLVGFQQRIRTRLPDDHSLRYLLRVLQKRQGRIARWRPRRVFSQRRPF